MVLELFAGSILALGIGVLVVLIVVVSRILRGDMRREITRARELHARLRGNKAGVSDGRFELVGCPDLAHGRR